MMAEEKPKENETEELEGVFIPADDINLGAGNEGQKSASPGQEFDPEIAGIVAGTVGMLFGVAEKNRGAHWHIEQEQCKDYGEVCATFYQKQFGDSELSPAWALVGASFALLLMPVMGEIELASKKKKPEQKGMGEHGEE